MIFFLQGGGDAREGGYEWEMYRGFTDVKHIFTREFDKNFDITINYPHWLTAAQFT